ncbi:hypothetical protein EUX98_g9435 [Antrodiella citrinella]|uniref:Cyclin N-terminal domain-containing protein n=1 Tax=Antrodiella citrinella TaxID=2447956 RepID=A0A4S4LTQ2_9APHY|nr:hypothetical protein EUX98_g9435 [Antrodiella citrinella]
MSHPRGRRTAIKELKLQQYAQVQYHQPSYYEIPVVVISREPPLEKLSAEQYMSAAAVCTRFITHYFRRTTSDFVVTHEGALPLQSWIANFFALTQMRLYIIAGTLVMLNRFRACSRKMPQDTAGFEVFFVASQLSHKFIEESSFGAKSWSQAVQSAIAPARIVQLEIHALKVLQWRVALELKELKEIGRLKFGISFKFRNEGFM